MVLTIIILALAVAGLGFAAMKFGLLEDKDKDGIPDIAEDTIEEVKAKVDKKVAAAKERAKAVKEEIEDVVEAVKEVADQAEDVVQAAKGKKRPGRPRKKTTKK